MVLKGADSFLVKSGICRRNQASEKVKRPSKYKTSNKNAVNLNVNTNTTNRKLNVKSHCLLATSHIPSNRTSGINIHN